MMRHLLLYVGLVASFVVKPTSTARGWCPSELCTCYSTARIDCSNLNLRGIPSFANASKTNGDNSGVISNIGKTNSIDVDRSKTVYDVLDLSLNSIRRLKQDSFRSIRTRSLRLSYNKVPLVLHQKAFRGAVGLEIVSITNSRLASLPAQFAKYLNTLSILDLSRNDLTTLQTGQFVGALSLKTLDLTKNHLTELRAGIFDGLAQLQRLLLGLNLIVFVDGKAFQGLSNLRELGLNRNRIRDVQPGVFDGTSSLARLDLSENYIPALFPSMLGGLSALEELDLSNNPISSIAPESFAEVSHLRILKLSKTKLLRLKSRVFDGLNHLQTLFITNGYLQEIAPEVLSSLTSLTFLNLEGNSLETLNACAVAQMFGGKQAALRLISLTNNPITCDCRMKWAALPGVPRVTGRCKLPPTVGGENITQWSKYVVCPHGSIRCKESNEVLRIDEHPLWTYYM
jgi:Leucine-rich repeat (LRR) protein